MSKQKTYLAVTIDTECDKSKSWQVRKPHRFINIENGVAKYLQPLFESFNMHASYLLSPEVISDRASSQYFKSIQKKCELGTHLHAEYIDPDSDFSADKTSTFQSELDPETEKRKLENLTKLFNCTFGFSPRSFRSGRFGIGRHTLRHLEDLGYLVDSSITPDTWWMRSPSHGVNFLGSPYLPYHPTENDYRRKGGMKILEVPLTMYNSRLLNYAPALKRIPNPCNKMQRILLTRWLNPGKNLLWLRPTFQSAESMNRIAQTIIQRNVSQGMDNPVFLCMMFHSNEFEIGTSPYSMSSGDLKRIKDNLKKFLDNLGEDYQAVSLSDIYFIHANQTLTE